jgi:hypothetical protein
MRESTDRVEIALRSDDAEEQLVATRVLENPSIWRQWETEHSGLMRLVSVPGFRRTQVAMLKRATLRLIERKALFEYLRAREVRGDVRRRVFAYFHPTLAYSHAVIAEHGHYLRKACSFLCTHHVGVELVRDMGFLEPMQDYAAAYREYFQLFCDTNFTQSQDIRAALLPLLKMELEERRQAIMSTDEAASRQARQALQAREAREAREAQMRRATGNTARLRTLRLSCDARPV